MRIGIDFDNTIVSYEHVFPEIGKNLGWLPENFQGSKTQVRDFLRSSEHGEAAWTKLQAVVYGPEILRATSFPGFFNYMKAAADAGHQLFIVSHKTEFAAASPNGVNLREAAIDWMDKNNFFNSPPLIPRENVFFAATREEKCAIIGDIGAHVFIDDLIEVFEEPRFPSDVRKILFQPLSAGIGIDKNIECMPDWRTIENTLTQKI